MKIFISDLNSFSEKDKLIKKQNFLAEIGEKMGFYSLGIFQFNVDDTEEELSKRLDGIISSVEYGDIVFLQFPTGNGFVYDQKLLSKVLGYNTKIILIIHSEYLNEDLDNYIDLLEYTDYIMIDHNSFKNKCIKKDADALLVDFKDEIKIQKAYFDIIEELNWMNCQIQGMKEHMDEDEIHIGFGLYDKYGTYTPWLGVTIQSILEHTEAKVCFHILHDETLNYKNKRKLVLLVSNFQSKIIFHPIESTVFKSIENQMKKYTVGAMYRILLPEIVSNLKKIIYLDADLLVNRDVKELWDINLDDYCLAAVPDLNVKSGTVWAYPVREGLVNQNEYFNSGVLVLNLENIRKNGNMYSLIMEYLDSHRYSNLPDQDALNVIYKGQVYLLDENWNYFAENVRINNEFDLQNKIYHYVGNLCCLYSLTGMDILYYQTGCRTPWGHQYFDRYLNGSINRCLDRINQNESLLPLLTDFNIKRIFYGPEKESMKFLYHLIGLRNDDYRISNKIDKNCILPCYPVDKIKTEKGRFIIFVLAEADNGDSIKNLNDLGFIEKKDYFIIQKLLLYKKGGFLL